MVEKTGRVRNKLVQMKKIAWYGDPDEENCLVWWSRK